MPAKPITPTATVAHRRPEARPRSSRPTEAPAGAGTDGTSHAVAPTHRAAQTATMTNIQRQPTACPSAVAPGTPSTLATDSPAITQATAWPRRAGPARSAAARAAAEK